MRVLYTAFDVVPSPKGASVHITHFVRGLIGAGHTVHLITPGDDILPTEDTYEGATIWRIPPSPSADNTNFLARAVAFGQAVMEHVASSPPYDVVHYRSIWSGLHLAQAKTRYGYKTLFEVNGLPGIELKYHYPEVRNTDVFMKIREQERATLALSDVIVCPSEVTRAYLVSLGVPVERITVIRNGFNPDLFQATPLPTLSTDADGRYIPTIIYIGTLADWQGLDLVVAAVHKLLEHMPVRLRIVGRGRKRQRKLLAKRIRKFGLEEHVCIEPAIPHQQIPTIVADADVCVAPLAVNDRNLLQGCCPIKILEYMGAGRPIVASNMPVVRELMREDVDGLLFTPGDMEHLAYQLQRVLTDRALAQRLAHSAAEHVHALFTWQHAEEHIAAVYAQL